MNMCTNFKSISSKKGLRYDIKHVKKQTPFTSFRDLTVIFLILFFSPILTLHKVL